jgi:hypothetical protein
MLTRVPGFTPVIEARYAQAREAAGADALSRLGAEAASRAPCDLRVTPVPLTGRPTNAALASGGAGSTWKPHTTASGENEDRLHTPTLLFCFAAARHLQCTAACPALPGARISLRGAPTLAMRR